jgi:hypothetical protein
MLPPRFMVGGYPHHCRVSASSVFSIANNYGEAMEKSWKSGMEFVKYDAIARL